MNTGFEKVAKYTLYTVAVGATIATSPLYEYFGITAMGQRSVLLSTETTHLPVQASVEVNNSDEATSFNYCGWDVVIDLDVPIPSGSEVILWGLSEPWNQTDFEQAYVDAVDAIEEGDSVDEENTDGDTADAVDTSVEDSGSAMDVDTAADSSNEAPYEYFNPEHDTFYEVMRSLANQKYAYRITDTGTFNGPLFEEYASIVVQDSMRILYYSECGTITDHFVLTILGESLDIEATMLMVAHQGEQVAQPVGCGPKVDNPDYSNVQLRVTVQ